MIPVTEQNRIDYFNMEAATSQNSELLTNILKHYNGRIEPGDGDFGIMGAAAANSSSPPELLVKIVNMGHNDAIYRRTLRNPACPKDVVDKVLQSGIDSGKYELSAEFAAYNVNASKDVKLSWIANVFIPDFVNDPDPEIRELGGVENITKIFHLNSGDIAVIEEIKATQGFRNIDEGEIRSLISRNDSWYKVALKSVNWEPIPGIEIARSTKDPNVLTEILSRGQDDFMSELAAKNPNCPRELLTEIIRKKKNDKVSEAAAQNYNCPIELLTEILERGLNDNVSNYAARNPNCPRIPKLRWLAKNYVIQSIQPFRWNIPFEDKELLIKEIEKINEGLDLNTESMKDVLGKKQGWYKMSQDNYTREIATTTKDPNVLAEIIRRGNDDIISQFAIENPNCPPELLTEVVRRGKYDLVSMRAVMQLNCPPEALAEVLRRGNNDGVSRYAAQNPNCPPEALAEVLRRGKNDIVSDFAVNHSKCPIEAKIKWMRVTGKIIKEDPNKHIIDEVEKIEPDKDLEELRKMVSKKQGWYKMANNVTKEEDMKKWGRDVYEVDGLKYMAPKNSLSDPLYEIDVAKLDEGWKKDANFYMNQGFSDQKMVNFNEWIKLGNPIEAAEVYIDDDGAVFFHNGRHRFTTVRDMGKSKTVISIDPSQDLRVLTELGAIRL